MKMYRRCMVSLLTAAIWVFISQGASADIIGKGSATIFNDNEGSARQQALHNAMRDAVQQGVGVILDANTVVKNWTVIRDEIYSVSRGFVSQYTILRDEKQGGTWYVEIEAIVESGKIRDKLGELRILHQKMGNQRLMIINEAEHPDALTSDHTGVLSAQTAISDAFNQSGFRMFDQRTLGHLSQKTHPTGGGQEAWIQIADQQQVDLLVTFEIVSDQHRPFTGSQFTAANVTLRMKAFDVSTGRLIANVQSSQKQMTNARVGSFDWDRALGRASEKAGLSAAGEVIAHIVDYYQSVGDMGHSYSIVFQGFSEDEEDLILGILENLEGYQSLSELENEPNLLRIEYFSSVEKSRLRRLIRLAGKDRRISITSKEISGNRFVFVKP
jgi:hypothetical protein